MPESPICQGVPANANKLNNTRLGNGNSEETVDKTDGESSYSSFYSSFFKTESGSAEESDAKKAEGNKNKQGVSILYI